MEFEPVVAHNESWKVELVFSGDGFSGPYQNNQEDPEADSPIIRSVVYRLSDKQWQKDPDGNFLTYLQATDSRKLLQQAADLLLKKISENKTVYPVNLYNSLSYIHVRGSKVHINIPLDK